MPGAVLDEIELIIEEVHGNNGGKPPSRDDDSGGGGDDGSSGGSEPGPERPAAEKYSTAILLGMVSVGIFFLVLTAAFLFLRLNNRHTWVGIRIPEILWLNTCLLLLSSGTLELARRRLNVDDTAGFRRMWLLTTLLGLMFVAGQVIAWRNLASQAAHATTPTAYASSQIASGFFYAFTALHAAHLLGGIFALLFVGWRCSDTWHVGRPVAVRVASSYWHFMDGLWLFLLALLYLGR